MTLVRQGRQRVPHRVSVHTKAGGQNRFGGQLVTGAIKPLNDIAAQGRGNRFPDRGSGGHVIKVSYLQGLAGRMPTAMICLVVYTTSKGV